jgi:hypothetical protein
MVDTWTFFGRVYPERVPIHWAEPLAGILHQPRLNNKLQFRTIIHAGQIIVDLTPIEWSPDVYSLRNIAVQCATGITNLVGYMHGMSFTVEIISAINRQNDEWRVFGTELPALVARRDPHRPNQIDAKFLTDIAGSTSAAMVLTDLQSAMRDPIGTGFYCYRAIEAMMQSMKEMPDEDNKRAWPRLKELLRIDERALRLVQRHAAFPRHGRPSGMTDSERATVFEITDEIVRRYLEYITRGKIPLPEHEFQTLTV